MEAFLTRQSSSSIIAIYRFFGHSQTKVVLSKTSEFMRLYPCPESMIVTFLGTFHSATHDIMVLRGMVLPRIFPMRYSCSNLVTYFRSFPSTIGISSSSEITSVISVSLAWFSLLVDLLVCFLYECCV